MQKIYFVYVLSNSYRTVLYIGVTSDLSNRTRQHTSKTAHSFTSKYKTTDLIYAETFQYIEHAIQREKQLKGWSRMKKVLYIRKINPLLLTIHNP